MSRLPPLSSWSLRPSFVTPYGLIALLLLEACSGGEALILPGDGQPADIAVVEGTDEQSGTVGEPLARPLVVEVTDARGRPVEGAAVIIEFTTAGPGASVVPDNTETNAAGRAEAQLVLGTSIGQQTGRARVVTPEGTEPVMTTFTARALPESANRMMAVAGEDQTGHVGQPLDDQLVVEVTDGFGNPVEGVRITWAVEGGGSVSAEVVETGEDGRARVERILGAGLGRQAALATSEGLSGSPVTFVHTAIAGDASRLTVIAGNDQTAAAGSTLPLDLVVQLVDADGNGVPRTPLSWVIATGGGTPAPVNTVTDDEGLATTRWTLGDALGEQRIDAVVSGVGFISFRATATAGAPASLFIQTQPSSSAANGVPFDRQPVIQVRDARGNDVSAAGIQVRAAIASGGGELRGTLVRVTDAAGRATFTDLAISGDAGTRTLSFTAEGYAGVTSSEIAVGPPPPPPNQAPSASYTRGCTDLTCSFNSEGSSDPDGTIVAWRWTFGDGRTSDARNPSHTYGGAGTYQVTLTVTDDDGATHSFTQPVTLTGPPPSNQSPSASFTVNCANLVCSFNSDASSDPDGNIVDWDWTFGDGESSGSRNPGHRYDEGGTYQVTLTVMDNRGATGSATQSVTVTAPPPANEVPDADYNWNCDGLICRFTDRSDDDDGRVVAWQWDFGGSGTSADQNPTHRFPAPGEYQVTLTVTDDGGATDLSTAGVRVRKADSEINITSFAPEEPLVGQSVRIEFVVTGDGGTPTGNVTVMADDPGETCTGTVADGFCNLTFIAPGNRDITATYAGDEGFEGDSDGEDIQVDPALPPPPPPNQAPTAVFTPPSCTTGQACPFSGAGSSDPDGTIVSWTWDFGDGTATESGPDAERQHIYTTASPPDVPYQVTLTVTDDDGATGSVTHPVTVTDPAGLRTLNLRKQPSSPTGSGEQLDPQPEVELLTNGQKLKERDVVILAAVGSGQADLLGTAASSTDENGLARFTDLALRGDPGPVTLRFSATGYTSVDSQEIRIEDGDSDDD